MKVATSIEHAAVTAVRYGAAICNHASVRSASLISILKVVMHEPETAVGTRGRLTYKTVSTDSSS